MNDDLPYLKSKRCVHIQLLAGTHAEFRKKTFDKKLTMQEVLEEFIRRVVEDDPKFDRYLDEIVERKREKLVRSLMKTDADTILDDIDYASPFGSRRS